MQIPVGDLRGISQEAVKSLNYVQIWMVGDLLRISTSRLMKLLNRDASWEEVSKWHGVATLLEVNGMTLSWAEALAEQGLLTVRDMSLKSLEEMESLFTLAAQKNLIESKPSPSDLTEMLKDSVALSYTGTVMATVCNSAREPIAGASARIGRFVECTDERGRFRISRIPLFGPSVLELNAEGYQSQTIKLTSVPDNEITLVQVFKLVAAGERQQGSSLPAELSELAGDRLPPVQGSYVKSRQITGTIPEDEWLILTAISPKKRTAQLVSRLHAYKDGMTWVTVYKVPTSVFDGSMQIGDEFRMCQGKLIQANFTRRKLQMYKQLLRLKRKWKKEPYPVTPMEIQTVIERRIKELFQAQVAANRSERRSDNV